jgi:phospho-N-acetylmuramoyl-pentapeptide-transferase
VVFFIVQWFASLGVRMPTAFTYTSSRMALAAATTLLVSIFLGPRFITKLYELRIGQSIRMDECPLLGKLHEKKKDTPTMGGVLILCAMLLTLFLWMDLRHPFTLILFLATLVCGGLGAYDDYLKLRYKNTEGVRARTKLAVQLLFSIAVGAYLVFPAAQEWLQQGSWYVPPLIKDHATTLTWTEVAGRFYLPFSKEPVLALQGLGLFFVLPAFAFVITGTSNAVNLTDGLDGLAAGCLVLVSASLASVAFLSNNAAIADYLNILYIEGAGEIAVYLSAFAGACLGFLWYNGHPAQVFMGDTGSLALGGILGTAAVLLRREALLAIIGGIFVAEALSVIIQVLSFRYRGKKRVFLCAPLHHHFEYKGWPETKVVIRFWIIGLLLAILGLLSLKLQ